MVRVCNRRVDFLTELEHDQDPNLITNTKPRFVGSLHVATNLISDAIFGTKEKTFNHTFREYSVHKEDNEETFYSGCLKYLQENVSDIYLSPNPIPLPKDSNLDILGVIGESRMEFRTGYTVSNQTNDGDLISSVFGFSLLEWILILMFGLILTIFIVNYYRVIIMFKKKRKPWSMVFKCFSHFISKDFVEFKATKYPNFIGIILFTLTIFSYLCILFFTSLITTDLVSVSKPYVPYSYQDLIDNKSGIIIFSDEGTKLFFKSYPGSKEFNFYSSIEREKRHFKDYKEEYWKENRRTEPDYEFKFIVNGLHGRIIIIGVDITLKVLEKVACDFKVHGHDISPKLSYLLDDKYPWIGSDPDSQEYLLVFIKRNDFIPDKLILKRVTHMFQMGFKDIWNFHAMNHDYVKDVLPVDSKENELRECLQFTRNLKMPMFEYQSVKLANIKYLSIYFFSFLLISALIVFLEHRMKTIHRIRVIKQRIKLKRIRQKLQLIQSLNQ